MKVYRDFAYIYSKGPYVFSERMVQILPQIIRRFNLKPKTLLDLACGDGRFAVIMAKKGMQVTGVDASGQMLKYARKRARKAKVKINLVHQKMQSLSLKDKYDLITCWFESLNYLLSKKGLLKTFLNVNELLNETGVFIFDVVTIYGFSHVWTKHTVGVVQDKKDIFDVHYQPRFNRPNRMLSLKIIGFIRKKKIWHRVAEVHRLRGYTLNEIRKYLRKAKLKELACWGDIKKKSPPKPTSNRVWFVVQKQ